MEQRITSQNHPNYRKNQLIPQFCALFSNSAAVITLENGRPSQWKVELDWRNNQWDPAHCKVVKKLTTSTQGKSLEMVLENREKHFKIHGIRLNMLGLHPNWPRNHGRKTNKQTNDRGLVQWSGISTSRLEQGNKHDHSSTSTWTLTPHVQASLHHDHSHCIRDVAHVRAAVASCHVVQRQVGVRPSPVLQHGAIRGSPRDPGDGVALRFTHQHCVISLYSCHVFFPWPYHLQNWNEHNKEGDEDGNKVVGQYHADIIPSINPSARSGALRFYDAYLVDTTDDMFENKKV